MDSAAIVDDAIVIEDNEDFVVEENSIKLLPIKRSADDGLNHAHVSVKKSKSTYNDVESGFRLFRKHLMRHLNHSLQAEQTRIFKYLTDTKEEISRVLKQSIIQKESHSIIMVGPRNSYKSFLIDHELRLLSKNYKNQFITVKLNGFIHSENAAINGIAAQLQTQLEELQGTEQTLAEPVLKEQDAINTDISSGSLTEVFEKILRLLDSAATKTNNVNKSNNDTKITVLFVFDEIDTFAGPVRQTLLYNLFDMVEHARVPVCIFGNTTKLNILEYLEKRVKSRFSQRIVYMPQLKDLDEFANTVAELLSPLPASLENDNEQYLSQWNNLISELVKDEKSNLFNQIRLNYDTFKSLATFKNSIIPLIGSGQNFEDLKLSMLSCKLIEGYHLNQLQNGLTSTIRSLSDLELAVLIAAARVSLKSKDEMINFNLTYVEYKEMIKSINAKVPTSSNLTTNRHLIKLWEKDDVKNVWETLQGFTFITEKGAIGIRESAIAAFYASNYQFHGSTIPFDLRLYQMQVTLKELRTVVPRSSMYYTWTQL
ncbi:hypothetical protein KAFR_0B00510 [Kazachstania africana CBS 2517]|uniref:Origin recognition complex subunit 4 n=1 Tax=Kazachstania africana (strain ATCC 22294 / BCRC 22015 / CBS 2517 / CECT 1963 / NBRC 1671 / NRRL Y-8276) TaxID=1071382 RepID=H2APQ0_KAZAF|nr:hypothetical protein KAFR_0B00510 [Kazachstania africana CBS 2517]CCF56350.1 hypothetical protein KAFR_0B00510 [Kazachstania africana CBS 2517]